MKQSEWRLRMDASKLFEGIALLIDLAQRGEIDPWDVQVIEVIDRYLSVLFASEVNQVACEADLSQPWQAFLSASMLVLFKAKTLAELEQDESQMEPLEDDFSPEVGDGITRLRLPLEQQLHRRPAALPPRRRRVTLQELIAQLQLMATQLQQQEAILASRSPRIRSGRTSVTQAARAIAQLAHQENLTEVADEIDQFLSGNHQEQDWLELDQLVTLWLQTKSTTTASTQLEIHERVSVFWALLLLSAQSKVELSQEEFYQEIKIRTLPQFLPSAIAPNLASA